MLTVAVLLILVGVIMVDNGLDNGTTTRIGPLLFGAGWLLVALTVSMEKGTYQPSWNQFLQKGLPALIVLAAASYAQTAMTRGVKPFMLAGVAFMLAWAYFALTNSFDGGFLTGWQPKQAGLLFLGASLVVVGMGSLTLNRRFSVFTGTLSGPSNVFNLGMPAFVIGWVLILVGLAMK